MADKESTLAIVIRTVDQATGGIRKIKGAINALGILAAPISLVGERLGALAREAGLPKVIAGFKGLGPPLQQLGQRLLMISAAAAAAVLGLKALIDEFDELGDTAEKLGVGVDFLAEMRFAAERAGVETGQLDKGLKSLSQNMGQLRAGTGKMKKFLDIISPDLRRMMLATKSNEEAFLLLANALSKIKDPAKRAALAQKALGDSELAPLLARDAVGIEELRKRFRELAGSQEAAAKAAGIVDDSLKDLGAATQGIKAALVEGLSPAFRQLVDELRAWFRENRERIAEWAKDFGEKLPGRIHKFADAFLNALDTVEKFIVAIGGAKTVALAFGAVLVGPLVASVLKLTAVLMANPIGLIAVAIAGAAALIITNWEPISAFFKGLWDGVISFFEEAWEVIKAIVDKIVGVVEKVVGAAGKVRDFFGGPSFMEAVTQRVRPSVNPAMIAAAAGAGSPGAAAAAIKVDFANTPKGTRVTADSPRGVDVDMTVGYQMFMGVP